MLHLSHFTLSTLWNFKNNIKCSYCLTKEEPKIGKDMQEELSQRNFDKC